MSSSPASGSVGAAVIRPGTPADAGACADIYTPYVTDSIVSFEEEPPTAEEMRRRMEAALLWLVAERDHEICGYAYGSPHRQRAAYRWAADVAIYMRDEHRGQGLGRRLYAELFEGLRARGKCVLCAGVALPNPASEALHRTLGFTEVGVYRRIAFKLGRWIDTRWYQLDLCPDQGPPPPLPAERSAGTDGAGLT